VPTQRWESAIRLLIDADGRVLDARLQPGSGRVDVDRIVLEPVFAGRWRFATLDGRPVKVWLVDGRATLSQ
jgi:outer membrane biosynthesis protein TonB